MTTKEVVAKLLDALPDSASIEDVQYHLWVLQKIHAGEAAPQADRVVPHDDVMRELARWLDYSAPFRSRGLRGDRSGL